MAAMAQEDRSIQSFSNPVLHLDGRRLRTAFNSMVDCAEKLGGIEVIVEGLSGKSILFQRTFCDSAENLLESEFLDTCAFMPTVRRRIKSVLERLSFSELNQIIHMLLTNVSVENIDEHIEAFESNLQSTSRDRWIHDLAAEILHFREPDTFPLMTRWIWDYGSNSGVLREIWFSDSETDYLNIPNGIRTHLELRRELSEFLDSLGVYKNINYMIDVLFAWIYSQYIGNQGGSFLKTDFSFTGTPFGYVFRMLGLDAALSSSGKSRLILANGKRYCLSGTIDAVAH